MTHIIHTGSNLDVLPTLPDNSIDAIVTDPPYELGFMGKVWDSTGIAYNLALWKECLRVLKPGGHILAFSGSRTYHRMTCAIEDAGFEVRDQMMWVYGTGFPKSHNISKAIDKVAGAEREVIGQKTAPATEPAKQWDGWGTALKPAHEPICLARKPIEGTVADSVLKWGVGGLNIDDCRVGEGTGRFPSNLMHDGSPEVLELFPEAGGGFGVRGNSKNPTSWGFKKGTSEVCGYGDSGSAARFFYCPKASKADRNEGCETLQDREWKAEGACIPERGDRPFNPSKNNHPTVKPTELMRYLCRLITPPGGTVLDPFNGSGSTGKAAVLEGFNYVGIELDPDYVAIAEARINAVL